MKTRNKSWHPFRRSMPNVTHGKRSCMLCADGLDTFAAVYKMRVAKVAGRISYAAVLSHAKNEAQNGY